MDKYVEEAIFRLKNVLTIEYGDNYSFIICGGGKALAARSRNGGDLTEDELKKLDAGKIEMEVK